MTHLEIDTKIVILWSGLMYSVALALVAGFVVAAVR